MNGLSQLKNEDRSPIFVWAIDPNDLDWSLDLRSLSLLKLFKKNLGARLLPVCVADKLSPIVTKRMREFLAKNKVDFAEGPLTLHCESQSTQDRSARVIAFAEDVNAAQIILASRGGDGPKRWVNGSFAEQVIEQSSVPVILLQRPTESPGRFDESPLNKFLFATDFSDPSMKSLAAFIEEIRPFDGELIVYHDLGLPAALMMDTMGLASAVTTEYLQDQKEWVAKRSKECQAMCESLGVQIRLLLEEYPDRIGWHINQAAAQENVLLVGLSLSSHPFESFYFGSTARGALTTQRVPLWFTGPQLQPLPN